MQALLQWTLESIRAEGSSFSWMEERRYDWVPLIASVLTKIENAYSVVLITDPKREWFEKYIISNINQSNSNRPLLPFVSLSSIYQEVDLLKSSSDFELVNNMLSLSFKDEFFYFYIGSSNHQRAQIAKYKEDSFMWIFDEQLSNSITLDSKDKNLDIKLIQLFKLFNKSIDAMLYGEIDING